MHFGKQLLAGDLDVGFNSGGRIRSRPIVGTILAFGLFQAGCATTPPQASEPPPANYREIIARHVRESFLDPYSIRDASIAPPKPGQLSRSDAIAVEQGYIVCFRANAKNRVGGYTGMKTTAFLVRGGAVVTSHTGDDHYEVRTSCGGVAYESFREVEMTGEPPRGRGQP
jgi:hypothetical protein